MYCLHCRDTDNEDWLKNVIVKKKDDKVSLEIRPVVTKGVKIPERSKIPYMIPIWKIDKK